MAGKMLIAYQIIDRGGKNYWQRIGVGFINQDGSINVKLEALPLGGEFQLRSYAARDEPVREEGPSGG